MLAFAIGYSLKRESRTVECWDILTSVFNYHCERGGFGWKVYKYPNPTGKINGIYFANLKHGMVQSQEWNVKRYWIPRLETPITDFADPIAAATADVIQSIPKRNKPGKLIQLTGKRL